MKTERSLLLYFAALLSLSEAARTRQALRNRGNRTLVGTNATLREFGTVPLARHGVGEPPGVADVRRKEGQYIDYNPETKIYWSADSPLPLSVEAIIAVTWITMVATLPFLAFAETFTRSLVLLAAVMWFVLLCGVYLFTQVLLFQSSHFETVRSLTLVECVYFMSQVLTTVGYGDITPAKPRGQVFVGLYVVFCLCIIMNFVSEVVNVLGNFGDQVQAKLDDLVEENGEALPEAIRSSLRRKKWGSLAEWMPHGPPPLPWKQFIRSGATYLVCCCAGIAFFTMYPGEGKSLLQGIYMSVITLSTVGFGAVTPVTEGGKVFGAFWMLIGSTALVRLIACFSSLLAAMKEGEQWDPQSALDKDQQSLEHVPENVNRLHFLKFALLHKELTTQQDLDRIVQVFYLLQPDGEGTISKQKVLDFFRPPKNAGEPAAVEAAPSGEEAEEEVVAADV